MRRRETDFGHIDRALTACATTLFLIVVIMVFSVVLLLVLQAIGDRGAPRLGTSDNRFTVLRNP
jgi:hypothetical protein